MMPRSVLCELVTAWSARWHALTEAAEVISDPAEVARLLAMAEGIETCDLDARRAVREIVTGTTGPIGSARPGLA